MTDVIENLKKLANEYRKNLHEINDKIKNIEEIPQAKALVGKYFKFQNSFGSGSKWWLYFKITGHDDENIIVNSFEEDANGTIEFQYDKYQYFNTFSDPTRYIPTTEEEYFEVQNKIIEKIINKSKRSK